MMGNYLDKWKTLFPEVVGGTKRPLEAISDQDEFNTNGFPQFIAQDPVRYDLQNAFLKQFLSNDAWLWVRQQQADQALDRHKDDAQAHPNGVSGNAASATKLQTARSLNLGGAVTADAATFDGTANATINVKTLDATKLKGTASVSTTGNAATATKVVTTAVDGASANIAEATMASNDLARIRVSGTTNAGELALETADDGSEPIVARQYTGIYTTPVRTAKILDESGNTSFPGTVVAPKFTGALNGNAATATKLQTPRTLSLTGKAAGSATFDGSANAAINVTSVNADTASKLSTARKINITGNASGSSAFDGSGDVSISITVNESKHAVNADVAKTLQVTEGNGIKNPNTFNWVEKSGQPHWVWGNDDDANTYAYNPSNFHVAKADTATTADTATKVNATVPNGGEADLAFGTMAANDYARIRVGGKDDNGWLEIATADGGNESIFVRQYSGPYDWPNGRPGTVTNEAVLLDGSGNTKFPHNVTAANFVGHLAGNADSADVAKTLQLVEGDGLKKPTTFNWIGKSGQPQWLWGNNDDVNNYVYNPSNFHVAAADSATNADKVDGYHASDLLRILGGNRTPVITDIFDRAGTIDMSTMSAADKATHKANINKAANAAQNIWNTDTGIYAYGGDYDISGGYIRGTLKLTQSYKNFDKIMVVGTEDKANFTYYKLWDVWELANAFANNDCFMLITSIGNYWVLAGTAKHGNAIRKLSTDTIWSCQQQNSGIVAIYGIKY